MEIFINGEVLDFTLNNEGYLDQVLEQLEQWAHSQGACISDVYLNEQPLASGSWPHYPLDQVWKVEICLLSDEEGLPQQLRKLEDYCHLFAASLQQGLVQDEGKYFLQQWPLMEQSIRKLVPSFSLQPLQQFMLQWTKSQQSTLLAKELEALACQLQHFSLLLSNEQDYQKMLAAELKQLLLLLVEVGLSFQKNGRAPLLALLQRLLTWLSDFERLARSNALYLQHYQQVHPVLEQIVQAMKLDDWLLVGDLLEYELQPPLSSLYQELFLLYDLTPSLQEKASENDFAK